LVLESGSFTALLGSNGAGKTTTLLSIIGQARVHAGRISFDGDDLVGRSTPSTCGKGIALSPEGRQLFPSLSVQENLEVGALVGAGRARKADSLERVFSTFPLLHERREQISSTLSGGEQQMLAIGRALMSDPRLLLIDEASLGLAPIVVERVFELISAINASGVTVLAVEQNVSVVEHADAVYVLEKGTIVSGGATATIGTQLRSEILAAYLGEEAS
ncbi:MAG: transporter ATP-binding protein, partial [Frankiales bacterium]|nr:transporter ATP-binding protein [Frankiales bacterium]